MADVIDSLTGFGTTAGTGTKTSPETLMTLGTNRRNFVTLQNNDGTNWLFAKSSDDPGCFKIAPPGGRCLIGRGPPSANNLFKIVGFGATPSNAGTAAVQVLVVEDKMA